MNIRIPLGAALLMTALSASAQLTLTQPTFSLTNQQPPLGTIDMSKYNAPGTKIPSDDAFNCSTMYNLHIPYKFCTPEQEMERLSFLGFCPWNNKACKDYMDRIMIPKSAPVEQLAEEQAREATAAKPQPAPVEAGAPVAAAGAFSQSSSEPYGPPLPPDFYKEQNKKAVEAARAEIGSNGVRDIVDLGDGKMAKMRDDGTVQMCSRASGCAEPVPADSVNDPKVQSWVAENKGYAGVNNNPGGGGMKMTSNPGGRSAPQDPPGGSPGDAGSQDTGGGNGNETAFNFGSRLGSDIGALSGPGGPSSSGYGGGFGSGAGYSDAGTTVKAIAVSPDEVKRQAAQSGYTYTAVGAAAANSDSIIKGGAKALNTTVETDDNTLQYRGIQSSANGQ